MGQARIVINFSVEDVIFNTCHDSVNHVINYIMLIIKQLIYRCRCQNTQISLDKVEAEVKYLYNLEKFNAKKSNVYDKFVKKWSPVQKQLE